MDLQPAQELVHGLRGGGSHLRAVLAGSVGAAAGQEAHQDVDQGGIGHHLLRRAFLRTHPTAGAWRLTHKWVSLCSAVHFYTTHHLWRNEGGQKKTYFKAFLSSIF